MMLSDRRRLAHLPDIAETYAHIAERRSGRIRAEIVTAPGAKLSVVVMSTTASNAGGGGW